VRATPGTGKTETARCRLAVANPDVVAFWMREAEARPAERNAALAHRRFFFDFFVLLNIIEREVAAKLAPPGLPLVRWDIGVMPETAASERRVVPKRRGAVAATIVESRVALADDNRLRFRNRVHGERRLPLCDAVCAEPARVHAQTRRLGELPALERFVSARPVTLAMAWSSECVARAKLTLNPVSIALLFVLGSLHRTGLAEPRPEQGQRVLHRDLAAR
jgi:hypothetical protein